HALVHPAVVALVAAEDAVEPIVPHFVGDHVVQAFLVVHVADDGDHRIFHAAPRADGAINGGAGIVRVVAHVLAVETHALVHVAHGVLPELRIAGCAQGPGG